MVRAPPEARRVPLCPQMLEVARAKVGGGGIPARASGASSRWPARASI